MLMTRDSNRRLSDRHAKGLQDLVESVAVREIDRYHPSVTQIKVFEKEVTQLEGEPILNTYPVEQVDPLQNKKDISRLQKELK